MANDSRKKCPTCQAIVSDQYQHDPNRVSQRKPDYTPYSNPKRAARAKQMRANNSRGAK